MIKNSKKLFLIFALVSILLLINTSCKDFGIPDYTLTIIHGDGVGGLPAAGTYTYKELSSINYDYIFTDNPEISPNVFVNDISSSYASSGTIIMYRDIEMYVGTVDFRGQWELTLTETGGVETVSVVNFTGDSALEGNFTDGSNYEGTWKNVNNAITITYSNRADYKLEGLASPKYLYGTVYAGATTIGSWKMTKK